MTRQLKHLMNWGRAYSDSEISDQDSEKLLKKCDGGGTRQPATLFLWAQTTLIAWRSDLLR
eukprot:CAMPEP_0170628034 /NCGR_PEP_ID=MMETSP0224-20130122/32402_1 /TAXON_ID=285029 /ORGANISM="Togula jolla, Strain CCCM 725" /LENGTH=60 /DNA_ID=CAMNT_0010955299 /DNA_START=90 /DNA_END=268 /DNA_ORIENTATION=-